MSLCLTTFLNPRDESLVKSSCLYLNMFFKFQEWKNFPLGSHRFLGVPLFQYFEERHIIHVCSPACNSIGTQLLNTFFFKILRTWHIKVENYFDPFQGTPLFSLTWRTPHTNPQVFFFLIFIISCVKLNQSNKIRIFLSWLKFLVSIRWFLAFLCVMLSRKKFYWTSNIFYKQDYSFPDEVG